MGTDMHAGFMLSRRLLARHAGGNRQILMVTDGEPTAQLEGEVADFSYPPMPRTIQETLKEVQRCTRERIIINTFMLERSPWLTSFVEQMARINRGRAFFATPDRLGEYLVVDYVSARRRAPGGGRWPTSRAGLTAKGWPASKRGRPATMPGASSPSK